MRPRYITATRSAICRTTEIVRDEEVGRARARPAVRQQVDDLRLYRHVERRHRLVADDQARAQSQRARDADALALAAREFVRIALRHARRRSPRLQHFLRPAPGALGDRAPARCSGSAIISPTVMRGLSDAARILKDDLHRRPHARASLARQAREMSVPSKRTVPAVGSISRISSGRGSTSRSRSRPPAPASRRAQWRTTRRPRPARRCRCPNSRRATGNAWPDPSTRKQRRVARSMSATQAAASWPSPRASCGSPVRQRPRARRSAAEARSRAAARRAGDVTSIAGMTSGTSSSSGGIERQQRRRVGMAAARRTARSTGACSTGARHTSPSPGRRSRRSRRDRA